MTEKISARRSALQATYTPIKLNSNNSHIAKLTTTRGVEKAIFFRQLNVQDEEVNEIIKRIDISIGKIKKKENKAKYERQQKLYKNILNRVVKKPTLTTKQLAKYFSKITVTDLTIFSKDLIDVRKNNLKVITKKITTLESEYLKDKHTATSQKGSLTHNLHPDFKPITDGSITTLAHEKAYKLERQQLIKNKKKGRGRVAGISSETSVLILQDTTADIREIKLKKPTFRDINQWCKDSKTHKIFCSILDDNKPKDDSKTTEEVLEGKAEDIEQQESLIDEFSNRMTIEPVGFLHLERLSFTPVDMVRGELVYSIPLAPKEEVYYSHKEWSNISEEYERIIKDYLEEYSEQGVVDNTEISSGVKSQSQHASNINTGVTASGEYGPVNITATASYSVNDSASLSEESSRKNSHEITSKSSSRSKVEHKISFRTTSVQGEEDTHTRKITNSESRPVRADYYRLMRKWNIDLHRYGIRLTYDLTIPEPGSGTLNKMMEINDINKILEGEFNFSITPNNITRSNYLNYAATYGASVTPPPDEYIDINYTTGPLTWDKNTAEDGVITEANISVNKDYKVSGYSYSINKWYWSDEDWTFPSSANIENQFNMFVGKSDNVIIAFSHRYVSDLSVRISLRLRLRNRKYNEWKLNTWDTLRRAEETKYLEMRQRLEERRERLIEELEADDALSLRKKEREEIMKGVMRWLFGPEFKFNSAYMYDATSDSAIPDVDVWQTGIRRGEFIKFIHQAIEWENMLYILYPYFWAHKSTWEARKYLEHPDSVHKSFLKSGAARVVLTIRKDFEKDFLSFMENGDFLNLPNNHPYFSLADELRAYDQTNYPGIPPANPETNDRPLLTRAQRATWDDMKDIMTLLEAFHDYYDRYPTTAEGIDAGILDPFLTGSITSVPTVDAWGKKFHYESPGKYNDYDLVSYGEDGVPGGEGDKADISSWATASLIGSWFQYTPTSALDIDWDQPIPEA